MRCQRAQHRLMAYHDSELPPGAARRLERHLESCEECSQLLEKLRLADSHATSAAGVKDMAGAPGAPAPDDRYWESFTARVLDRVEEDAALRVPERRKPGRKWDLMIPRMAPAFSLALVVVVAAGIIMKMGGPEVAPKAPAVLNQPVSENNLPVGDEQTSPAEIDDQDQGYSAAESAEEARDEVSVYRSTLPAKAAPLKESKKVPAPVKVEEDQSEPGKSTSQVQPVAGSPSDEDSVTAVRAAKKKEAPMAAGNIEEPLPLVTATTGEDATRIGIDEGSKSLQPTVEPVRQEDDQAQVEAPPVGVRQSQEEVTANISPETPERGVEKTLARESVPMIKPLVLSETENVKPSDTMTVAAVAPEPVDREEAGVRMKEETLVAVEQQPEEGMITVSGAKTINSPVATQETRQTSATGPPLYRGPEDQLVHAKNLADVRKFWESEQVLKDLLGQDLPIPIQEEASILLVKVLSGQNRNEEAQQVLEDARVQFPESEKVQTFQLKGVGEAPAQ